MLLGGPLHSSSLARHKCCCCFNLSGIGFLVIAAVVLLSSAVITCSGACNEIDHQALVSFSLNISSSSSPLNWNNSGDCCDWEGVGCDGNGRVTRLWLPSRDLVGSISPAVAKLTSLSQLNLSNNRLSGSLPDVFFSALNSLQVIDLSYNRLTGEVASDERLPSSIQAVNLSSNHFNGTIQSSFFQPATSLASLNFSNNSFHGGIPSLCSISPVIMALDFSFNDLEGQIPHGFGECSRMVILRAGFNKNISGPIPNDIYSVITLQELSLPGNKLSGPIAGNITSLISLRSLALYGNELTGRIPEDIGRLSSLEQLQLHINSLNGTVPPSLMNCTRLKVLNLRVNKLEVRLATNKLTGEILPETVRLESLSFLSISNNSLTNFTGAIKILSQCKSLSTLILSKSFRDESLPGDENLIGPAGFQNLRTLGLGGCNFTGPIPFWLSKLKKLEVLDLSQNKIRDRIPGWLGNLENLFYMDLSQNLLYGGFPIELVGLWRLSTKEGADQARSYLELPVFVQPNNASNLQYNQMSNLPAAIYLGNNNLEGGIPAEIGQLKYIQVLDLGQNKFSGSIPNNISDLTNLEILNLSWNNLSGIIPASLKNLHFLSSFNVANNHLEGPIPIGGQFDTFPNTSFMGNPGLCGRVLQHPCSSQSPNAPASAQRKSGKKKIVIGLILGICFGITFTLIMIALWLFSKRRVLPRGDAEKADLDTISFNSNPGFSGEVVKDNSIVVLFPRHKNETKDLNIYDILQATDNFNQENIIGCGGFGLVYKATLADGTTLAVKKLTGDMGLMEREFKAEVEALSTAQHENLVSLQGYCVHDGCRLLIYSYMENGSLDYWLHEKTDGASQLDWPTRLKIAQGASSGMRNAGRLDEIFDPLLQHKGFDEEMQQVLDVACMCVNQNPVKRPTITEVVDWLKKVESNRDTPKQG
nr:tyrosine-sulfated glycopeptide receptor 1 [Ipomoea trifida]